MGSGEWQEDDGEWFPPHGTEAAPEESPPFFMVETVLAFLVGAITVMLSSLLTPPATLNIVSALGPGRLVFTASAAYAILHLVEYLTELSADNPNLKLAIALKVVQGWGRRLKPSTHATMARIQFGSAPPLSLSSSLTSPCLKPNLHRPSDLGSTAHGRGPLRRLLRQAS